MSGALLLAAPRTGSGKTTLTLALLRALKRRGHAVASAKTGPDHIDPRFHEAASGAPCLNLDPWAMRGETLDAIAGVLAVRDLALIEGVMGLFDGAARPGAEGRRGATAEIAARFGVPVILVVDASGMGHSAAALVEGFARHDPRVRIAGLLVNNVASPRHAGILSEALAPLGLPLLGLVPRAPAIARPSRHLGLVQAGETPDLDAFIERAAAHVAANVDIDRLAGLAKPLRLRAAASMPLPPLGQRIAIAEDTAFRFAYPHVLEGWRRAGAELAFFSPLADEAPDPAADAVYLPGGYPELHAGRLAANAAFRAGLRAAASRGARLFGECGGYMVLGEGLEDGDGARHEMAGLLAVETSMAKARLHLGYAHVEAAPGAPLSGAFRAHEFHYAATLRQAGRPLFRCLETGAAHGLVSGSVAGSFLHLVDQSEASASASASACAAATGSTGRPA